MRTDDTNALGVRSTGQAAAKFRFQDIYFVLFRHKWKILIVGLLGIVASITSFLVSKPKYTSEAKVLIRYVRETRDTTGADYGAAIRTPDSRGDNIINSELEILTSLDLAREVVADVGATNIVEPDKGIVDPVSAAVAAVRGGVEVGVGKRSSVVTITFTHPRREVTGLVLSNLIEAYVKVHTRVHTASDVLSDATRQVTLRRESLATIEAELRRLKNELGIVSLDDAKKALLEQMNRLTGDILVTEAQIAEHRTALGVATNAPGSQALTNEAVAAIPLPVPPARVTEYRAILAQLDSLNRRESELSLQFKPESPFVRAVRDLITENTSKREKMETDFPGIALAANPPALMQRQGTTTAPTTDPLASIAMVRSLEAKLTTLRTQMAQLQSNAMRLSANEAEITDLQRRREIEDKQYTYHYNALEQARVDNALNEGKLSGLSVVENATPPGSDRGRILKISLALAAGGFLVGIGLAFLLEFFIDQSVRRPGQVERSLNVPLFVSVPRLAPDSLQLVQTIPRPQLTAGSGNGNGEGNADMALEEITEEERLDQVKTYTEALRDRLMMYFQMHGLNHKPKLVGVTSCGKGAGVTTIASHLASSLSETGDGNVLYVDVNPNRSATALPFRRGKALPGIDLAFSKETRDDARVQENLYMASLASPNSGKIGVIPRRLAGLVPRMKASDYDYIIFDLPPVMQTSATSKVAGLLDMTFVVVESEKTQTDLAKKTIELLGESRANVAVVLNKHKRYLPERLDTDL
ncbi:MAG: hypothetical protein IT581_05415 [Verrucomicrobiales bacterium]|nr:hypothetical protein [Verrucomicrobiales bacterium]